MKLNLTHYFDPEEHRIQTEVQSIRDGRRSLYGVIANESFKNLDKKHYSIIADATLDEIVDTINHMFLHYPLCDACEEPATRVAYVKKGKKLSKECEHACDECSFSADFKEIRPTSEAEAIHRAKALIVKLQDRK